MTSRPGIRLPRRQRGTVRLLLLALFAMVGAYILVSGLNRSTSALAVARAQNTTSALKQAKEALILYALTYKETHDNPGANTYTVPGYLPCPDMGPGSNPEGQAAPNCGSSLVSVMGRLPWQTLGLDALKDASGECLWYAVSGTYKNNPNGVSGSTTTSNMMNWDTNGQFNVTAADGTSILAGSTADTNAVAVIFAPGGVLSGQDRTQVAGTTTCGGNYNAAAYLETAKSINNSVVSGTASAQTTFIAGTSSDTFNDQLVYITRADIWNAIKKRSDFNNYLRALTRRAAECTAMYGTKNSFGFDLSDRRLPWPANVSISTTSVPFYAVDARYNDNTSSVKSGRLSFRIDTSQSSTNNTILTSTVSGTTNYYLPTSGSYCGYTADQQIWYDNWKDQLFYAIANSYRPSAGTPSSCGTCLTINGGGSYAAVVIFAGDKLTDAATGNVTQPRSSVASGNNEKGTIGNYLEGRNSSNHPNSGGNSDYQAAAASSTFNDIVYGIDNTLAIWCSDATGVMRSLTLGSPSPPLPGGDPKAYAACP